MVLLKAASAVRLAQNATAAGQPHVPIFWLASEDHDFAEVNHVSLPGRNSLETISIAENPGDAAVPVGRRLLGDSVIAALDEARFLLGHAPICDALAAAYTPGTTLADAFAKFMHRAFAGTGLILIDASTREFHSLGAAPLRGAITDAAELQSAILVRSKALEESGLHAQVAVQQNGSLLFLIDEKSRARTALRRDGEQWRAGSENYTTAELLQVLNTTPERLSANALLRPVFQDTLLPTSVYIGGPAELAYFAQSQVAYQHLLGRTTPVLPRLSATLVEQSQAHILDRYGFALSDLFTTPEALAQKLGASTLPIEGKQKLSAAGKSLDADLTALTEWMHSLDENLGRSGDVAASKMRYQMNRLRRLSANFEVQRSNSLAKHVALLARHLYPRQSLQERVLGGAWFLARYGDGLAQLLVEQAAIECPGHKVILL
jgi:bacillithiol biosynthesis cysteine-adding enzyme BshC